jgi:hypothetical protein
MSKFGNLVCLLEKRLFIIAMLILNDIYKKK